MIYSMIHTCHVLAENLFHFEKEQEDHSINPQDHGSKPLFNDDSEGNSKTMAAWYV